MAQENKFVVHHSPFRPSAMSLLRIDPDSLTSSFSSTSPTTFPPDPPISMSTQNLTHTTSTPPVEGVGPLANTTPRTGYEPNNIHETDATIFDQTDDYQKKGSLMLQKESLAQKKPQPQVSSWHSTSRVWIRWRMLVETRATWQCFWNKWFFSIIKTSSTDVKTFFILIVWIFVSRDKRSKRKRQSVDERWRKSLQHSREKGWARYLRWKWDSDDTYWTRSSRGDQKIGAKEFRNCPTLVSSRARISEITVLSRQIQGLTLLTEKEL